MTKTLPGRMGRMRNSASTAEVPRKSNVLQFQQSTGTFPRKALDTDRNIRVFESPEAFVKTKEDLHQGAIDSLPAPAEDERGYLLTSGSVGLELSGNVETAEGTLYVVARTQMNVRPTSRASEGGHPSSPLPDMEVVASLGAQYASRFDDPDARLLIRVRIRDVLSRWLDDIWAFRDEHPVAVALVAVEAALCYTDDLCVDAEMARGLADVLSSLRLDMALDEARRVGPLLNRLGFSLFPGSSVSVGGGEGSVQ